MKQSVIIIGGGIGGLFTGAFLARNGMKVTVLEKNAIPGGGLQCFRRKGKIFETGMHVMGGLQPSGSLYRICRYLGILNDLKIHHIPAECMDEIKFGAEGMTVRIPSGREAFVSRMTEYFPTEADGIAAYVDELYRLSHEVPLFYLEESSDSLSVHSEHFTWPANRLIAHYVADPRLRDILAYLNPLYGGIKNHTPAYVHALINVLYLNGASRFAGGSQQLADALCRVIAENGGRVLSGHEVVAMDVAEKRITAVRTAGGDEFTADRVISSVHPAELLRLVPRGTFLKGFVRRLDEIPVSYSAFTLFIDLKPGMFRYIDHTCYFVEGYGSMWNQHEYTGDDWPHGFMYMTPPDERQGEFAGRMLVHCIMDFDRVRQWEATETGRRGAEYGLWKQARVDEIMKKLCTIFPGFRDMVAEVYAASPLTIRDYYHTKNGAIFGNRKDCENLMLSQLPVHTKISNLLLTGQNINLHGICGVPLTAITTAEAILGKNFLTRQIRNATTP